MCKNIWHMKIIEKPVQVELFTSGVMEYAPSTTFF